MIEDAIDREISEMKENMRYYGLKFEDYLKYTNTTEEDLRKERKEPATKSVKQELVLNAIITKENLVPGGEELQAEVKKYADEQGWSEEELNKNADEHFYNYVFNKLMNDKIIAFLRANNVFEEKKATKKDSDAE